MFRYRPQPGGSLLNWIGCWVGKTIVMKSHMHRGLSSEFQKTDDEDQLCPAREYHIQAWNCEFGLTLSHRNLGTDPTPDRRTRHEDMGSKTRDGNFDSKSARSLPTFSGSPTLRVLTENSDFDQIRVPAHTLIELLNATRPPATTA